MIPIFQKTVLAAIIDRTLNNSVMYAAIPVESATELARAIALSYHCRGGQRFIGVNLTSARRLKPQLHKRNLPGAGFKNQDSRDTIRALYQG